MHDSAFCLTSGFTPCFGCLGLCIPSSSIGFHVDENTTLRISAIEGIGVAFALIIGENGDSQVIAAVPA
jgi:hypothetical protein